MSRIVYTVALDDPIFGEMAMGLARSLSLFGDRTPRAVITNLPGFDWPRYFDHVLAPEEPREWIYYSKLTGLKRTH